MKLTNTFLLISLIVVWCSVFVKYETFARSSSRSSSGSRSSSRSSSSGSTFRFRSAFGRSKSSDSSPSHTSRHEPFRFSSIFRRSSSNNAISNPGSSISSAKYGASNKFNDLASKISMAKSNYIPIPNTNIGINRPGYANRAPYNHFAIGSYYGYNYRPKHYRDIQGSLCTNYNDYRGIVLGQFYCPIEGFSREETACCGVTGDQYCCSPVSQYQHSRSSNGFGYMAFIFVVVIIIIIVVLVFINFKKKQRYSEV